MRDRFKSKCKCFFVSDLHGNRTLYLKLFEQIKKEKPEALFLGGDLLPSSLSYLSKSRTSNSDFVYDFLAMNLRELKNIMGKRYPKIFLILGNDDGRFRESAILDLSTKNLWTYAHNRCLDFPPFKIFGYSYIPPSPFPLKDWERYDVSRYVDPGCSHPYEGYLSIPKSRYELYFQTIKEDLEKLIENRELKQSIFLFHSPPYRTKLDRADLDGKKIDHVPLDVNVGSIAIKRFIKREQPLITLHGHVHESSKITGSWRDRIRNTYLFSAAYHGKELALIIFDPFSPEKAIRKLI